MASSSEENSNENDDESSSSEEEAKNVSSPQAPIPNPEDGDSDSDSDSDSGSDSDSESESDDIMASKPIASEPIQETPSSKQPRSNVSKRVAENEVSSQPKKSKSNDSQISKVGAENDVTSHPQEGKGNDSVLNSNRKPLFQRLFSEEDEIVLLEGIVEFIEKKGTDPMKYLDEFYVFIRSSVSVDDLSVSQLKDKVMRLKKRFENNVSKSKFGEKKKFFNSQTQQIFDLMRRIWGSEGVCVSGAKSSFKSNGKAVGVKVNKVGSSNEGKKVWKEKVPGFRDSDMEDYVMRMGKELLEEEVKVVMENKWKEMHEAELDVFVRRRNLVAEQARLVLAAVRNKKN